MITGYFVLDYYLVVAWIPLHYFDHLLTDHCSFDELAADSYFVDCKLRVVLNYKEDFDEMLVDYLVRIYCSLGLIMNCTGADAI